MKAQIITIGDELLIGQTIDTNSAWMGAELSKLGFDVCRKISVHDHKSDILGALSQAAGKSDVVLITGGLGPTSDDITKPTLCEFFSTRLITNPEVLGMIEAMMKRRGISMNDNNRRQADVPESCLVLRNSAGTAPGMWFEKKGTIFISMPGVPHEMKFIMKEQVIPLLAKRFSDQVIIHRNIMTYGKPEALLAELLADFEINLPPEIRLAYLPSYGVIKLRLTGTGKDKNTLNKLVEKQVRNLYRIIPDLIFGENEDTLEIVVGKLLREKRQWVCTAESCTGGKIAHLLTTVSGSSTYFRGSVIAYNNSIKVRLLGVPGDLIEKFGAVSEEVVVQMAMGAKKLLNADFAVATSGIAGPDGGTPGKPVGTLWIAVASADSCMAEKYNYGSDRITNINRFSYAALNLLRKQINKD